MPPEEKEKESSQIVNTQRSLDAIGIGTASSSRAQNGSLTEQALADLDSQVSKAIILFEELSTRLDRIMVPRSDKDVSAKEIDRDSYGTSEIHQQIARTTTSVITLQIIIKEVHERIEI